MPTLKYARHGQEREETHDTVEEALRSAYWGEEVGAISTVGVYDDDGEPVYERGGGPAAGSNIFDFCEGRGYEWAADYSVTEIG